MADAMSAANVSPESNRQTQASPGLRRDLHRPDGQPDQRIVYEPHCRVRSVKRSAHLTERSCHRLPLVVVGGVAPRKVTWPSSNETSRWLVWRRGGCNSRGSGAHTEDQQTVIGDGPNLYETAGGASTRRILGSASEAHITGKMQLSFAKRPT